MKISAAELGRLLNGSVEGDTNILVSYPARIEEGGEEAVSFIAHPKYRHFAYQTKASVLIVAENMSFEQPIRPTLIRVKNPYESFAQVLALFNDTQKKQGIEHPVFISPLAQVGKNVYIGAFAYIGDKAYIGDNVNVYPQVYIGDEVRIGENTVIYAGVKIYSGCIIGRDCIIHSGAVIGSDGFGFFPQQDGSYRKIPQTGNVIIEDNVEIGAGTTIDRATVGSTIIRKGVKLDNLIQVAHNVEIDEDTVIAAQTGISGSTKLGKRCVIGGQVGFVGHIKIADGTKVNAKSGVSKSVTESGKALNGIPAFDYVASLRSQAVYRHLPEMKNTLEELEKWVKKYAQKSKIIKQKKNKR